jgi:excisionase family DNA binding protein
MKYVSPKEAARQLGVHPGSLRRWENEGKIKAVKTPGGQRRYSIEDIQRARGETPEDKIVLYARVSTGG